MNINKTIRLTLGFAISIASLYYVFFSIDKHDLITALAQVKIASIIAAMFLFIISCYCRGAAWSISTRIYERNSISRLFGGVIVGYLANNFLPLKGGEFVRALYVTKSQGKLLFVQAFATVALERVFDLLVVFISVLAAFFLGINVGVQKIIIVLAIIVAGAGVLLAIKSIFANYIQKLQQTHLYAKIILLIRQLRDPLMKLNRRSIVYLALWLICAWIANYFSILFLIYDAVPEHYRAAFILLLFINCGLLIPASPGSFGIMQLAFIQSLGLFGVSNEQAVIFSLAYQAGLYAVTIAIGVPYFLVSPIQLREINRARN